MNKTKKKNPGKTVWMFFIVIILIIVAGLIVTSIVFKNPDVTPSAFGYSLYIMDEEGMGEAVPEGALVVAKNFSPSADNIGDAILCEDVRGYGTTVLRLANIVPNTETVVYQGFFDNNPSQLIDVPADKMVGQAVSFDKTAGAVIRFITSSQGIATLVVVPILILLVCELIIGMYSKKAEKEARNAKYRRRMRAAEEAKKSPLNAEQLKSHKTPVTIDEYIMSHVKSEEKAEEEATRLMEVPKRKPAPNAQNTQGAKNVRPTRVPDQRRKRPERPERPERSERTERTERPEKVERTVYSKTAEKILAEDAAQKAALAEKQQAELKAAEQKALAEARARAEKELTERTAAAEEARRKALMQEEAKQQGQTAAETAAADTVSVTNVTDSANVMAAEPASKLQNPSPNESKSFKSSNESLARLMKLMEEQEKILRDLADKQ